MSSDAASIRKGFLKLHSIISRTAASAGEVLSDKELRKYDLCLGNAWCDVTVCHAHSNERTRDRDVGILPSLWCHV